METILASFSTRETALVIWIGIAFILCLLKRSIRNSFAAILKAFFVKQILASLFLFFSHTFFYAFILSKLGLWDISLLKETIFWIIGFAFVALVNINHMDNVLDFKRMFLDALRWTIVIEFIMNFFTFSLAKELFILPVVFFSAVIQESASYDIKHKPVETVVKRLFLYFSIAIFGYSLYKTVLSYNSLFTFDNLKSFLLPVVLSITFLPFMYVYNLYVKYETLWITLKYGISDDRDRNRIKWQILRVANFNINKVVSISKNIAKPIYIYQDLSYEMVRKVSIGRYIGPEEQDQ